MNTWLFLNIQDDYKWNKEIKRNVITEFTFVYEQERTELQQLSLQYSETRLPGP